MNFSSTLSHFLRVKSHTEFVIALEPPLHNDGLLFFHLIHNLVYTLTFSLGLFHTMEDFEADFSFSPTEYLKFAKRVNDRYSAHTQHTR